MPYLITTSLYPSEIAPKVGERYLEALAKYPPDDDVGTEIVPAAVKSSHKGIRVLSVSEIKEGKLDAAYTRATNMMVMFQNIPGFVYTVKVHLKVEEAMAAIGMDMP